MCRVLWSFSRDGGVPLYKVWAAINWWTGTPVNAVWAMAALAFLMGLPMLFSFTVFQAILSISSVGLYASCARCALLSPALCSCPSTFLPPPCAPRSLTLHVPGLTYQSMVALCCQSECPMSLP